MIRPPWGEAERMRISRIPVNSSHGAWFQLPNVRSVLGNRPVAREFSSAGYVQDGFFSPRVPIGIQRSDLLMRLQVECQVRQVHIEIPAGQKRVAQGRKDAWLVPAEVIGGDEVQCSLSLRIVLIVPSRVVPTAASSHLLRREAE